MLKPFDLQALSIFLCIKVALVTDGACGTGGMLTVAQDRLNRIAAENGKKVSIHLFGQEIQPETYAIAKADMMLKGDGEEAMHIAYGSTLSSDQHAARSFDFMLAIIWSSDQSIQDVHDEAHNLLAA